MSVRRRAVVSTGALAIVAATVSSCGRIGYDLLDDVTASDVRDAGSADARRSDAAPLPRDGQSGATDARHGSNEGGLDAGGVADSAVRDAAVDSVADSTPDGETRDGSVSPPDGATHPDASNPPPDSGAGDSGTVACTAAKEWTLDFNADPTLVDSDHDGVLDWVLRNAPAFPANELAGGVWHSTTGAVLDSRPMDPFSSRTVVDVRMQSFSVPASGRGAVFWVNLNEDQAAFSALFVNLMLEADGGQTLALYGKVGTTETVLASFTDLPETMTDVHLDIDPVALSVALTVNSVSRGSYAIPQTSAPNTDHFATFLAWEGVADFDFVRVQRCPP